MPAIDLAMQRGVNYPHGPSPGRTIGAAAIRDVLTNLALHYGRTGTHFAAHIAACCDGGKLGGASSTDGSRGRARAERVAA
jgi:hypothetical protein